MPHNLWFAIFFLLSKKKKKEKEKSSKSSSLSDKGSRLLVGTTEGVLLDYDVRDGTGNEPFSVNLLASRKNFSKKPVEQLQVVESIGVLLCLTGKISLENFRFL